MFQSAASSTLNQKKTEQGLYGERIIGFITGTQMTILLIEDNLKTRKTIKRILEQNLTDVTEIIESDDGKEAVALYKKHRPKWVLMDINIKSQDGLTAASEILTIDKEAKIIIVTMYHDPEYRDASESLGVHGFLLKENLLSLPELLSSN